MSSFESICFTAYGDAPPVHHATISYLIYQREVCPTTGRDHWQGYAEARTKNGKTVQAWQRALGVPGAHVEKRRAMRKQARRYCTTLYGEPMAARTDPDFTEPEGLKELSYPPVAYEGGVMKEEDVMGKRTDLEKARAVILTKRRWDDVIRDEEISSVVARNGRWCREVFNTKPKNLEYFSETRLAHGTGWYPWQKALIEEVAADPPDRKVIWYVGEGNDGKSSITEYFVARGAALLGGKGADVLHVYDNEEVAIFDIPKEDAGACPYGAIEKVKDGSFMSGKYEGKRVLRDYGCHVIVMANFFPDMLKLVADRWDVRDLSGPHDWFEGEDLIELD